MTKVVVTGVSSFVGHHLARYLAVTGHQVVGTISRSRDRYRDVEGHRLNAIADVVELAELDLLAASKMAAFVDRHAPALWIQHAGFAAKYQSPDYDLNAAHLVNIAPLAALYRELARGRCGVILTGSSTEYASDERANRESDACLPDSPYGLSKLTETLRARQLAAQWDVPTRVARVYIPFGIRDNPAKLLAQTLAKLRSGEPIALSPCEQKRDFIGVADVCSAYNRLALDLPRARFDVFNVAGGRAVVLRDFLCEIATRLGARQDLLHFGALAMRPGEPMSSYADIEKARQILDWTPTPLAQAIDRDLLAPSA
jgi:nucleoside-diphosphate-sugar epimerase